MLVGLLRLQVDGEEGMGSGGLGVHVGGSGGSVAEPNLHILLHDVGVVDLDLQQILDENPLVRALLQLHLGLDVLAQQVVDFLIVYLNEAAPDQVSLLCVIFGDGHDLREGPGDDALALLATGSHHGVGFAAARLPVGEYCSIVTIEHIVDQREGTLLVQQGLRRVSGEDEIVGETLGWLFGVGLGQVDGVILGVNLDD